jgi:hypothetical protein
MKPLSVKLGFSRRLRCIFISAFAKDFWKDFPPEDSPGPWVADAIVTGIAFRCVRKSEFIKGGLWDAYIRARELAVEVDWDTPIHPEGEIGVEWGVKSVEKELDHDICQSKKAA